jgi:dihydrofolate synthase/folylpolyglutamate synthase
VVHIAGTNGKGSVLAFLRAILEAAGHRVHCYTSPHLVRFHERIRLAQAPGQSSPIGEDALTSILEECETANGDTPITFFEITTAAAFQAFAQTPADVVLLEVGLGGRLDATNMVARPAVTAITPVAVDHVGFLGAELAGIAGEKAGILKFEVPAVVGRQEPAARVAIKDRAGEVGAPLTLQDRDWSVEGLAGGTFRVRVGDGETVLPPPALLGAHQIENAGHAVACLAHLPLAVEDAAMAAGMRSVSWPARLQKLAGGALADSLPRGAELWLDGGHNPAAAHAVAKALSGFAAAEPRPLVLVAGFLETKDAAGFLAEFAGVAAALVTVPVPGHAGMPPAEAAAAGQAVGIPAEPAESLATGVAAAAIRAADGPPPRVLICGSLYLAGLALAADGRGVGVA